MADIKGKIYGKYKIDIAQENLFKLYRIDTPDLSEAELQERFAATRKRWNQSINGANERNAERDRLRMEKADSYEAILRDKKLRKELYYFYNGKSGAGPTDSKASADLGFAREYFQLISTTKKIKKRDVEFFFAYYQEERKNKKAILEMLSKDFNVMGLGNESKYASEDSKDEEGKHKNEKSSLIVNLFEQSTIIQLRKCIGFYEVACQSPEICQKYPEIRDGLYEFLGLKEIGTVQEFAARISSKARDAYDIRQEKGAEFIPLVDFYNALQKVIAYRDVADNFEEFKLLVRYPKLTPYMFAFSEMKPETLKGMLDIANRDYVFRDDVDFILNYFEPVHDNFGISDFGISGMIKRAEKKAKSNQMLNGLDEKLGRKKKRKIPFHAECIHWLAYYPIFVVYFVFEVIKVIFSKLHMLSVPVFLAAFAAENWLFPRWAGLDSMEVLWTFTSKTERLQLLTNFFGEGTVGNVLEDLFLSMLLIWMQLMIYAIPALLVASFVRYMSEDLNKRFDWIGLERTFRNMFQNMRTKTEDQYLKQRSLFYTSKMKKVLVNVFCTSMLTVLVVLGVHFAPVITTGYTAGYPKYEVTVEKETEESETEESEAVFEPGEPGQIWMNRELLGGTRLEVAVDAANIRSAAGTESIVLDTARRGTQLVPTGNQLETPEGSIWYEIYRDEEQVDTGWISGKLVEIR